MKTIILNQPHELKLIHRNDIAEKNNHAIVQIKRIGICGTDYHAFRGNQPFFTYPRVLGHELGGIVVSIGQNNNASALNVGDRVAIEPYINCSQCQACLRGKYNCCENLNVIGVHSDGGMAEYLSVPLEKLHVSHKLNFEQLALVETLGIGLHAVNRAEIGPSTSVLIIGAGPIGMSTALFASQRGAKVLVADKSIERLDFILEHRLASDILYIKDELNNNSVRKEYDGFLPEVIFDATGNPTSMQNSFNLIAHGGRIIWVGLVQGQVVFDDPNFHRREITLCASRNSLPSDFKNIINLMESGTIDITPWITHRTSLIEVPDSFKTFLNPNAHVVKAMIQVE